MINRGIPVKKQIEVRINGQAVNPQKYLYN